MMRSASVPSPPSTKYGRLLQRLLAVRECTPMPVASARCTARQQKPHAGSRGRGCLSAHLQGTWLRETRGCRRGGPCRRRTSPGGPSPCTACMQQNHSSTLACAPMDARCASEAPLPWHTQACRAAATGCDHRCTCAGQPPAYVLAIMRCRARTHLPRPLGLGHHPGRAYVPHASAAVGARRRPGGLVWAEGGVVELVALRQSRIMHGRCHMLAPCLHLLWGKRLQAAQPGRAGQGRPTGDTQQWPHSCFASCSDMCGVSVTLPMPRGCPPHRP